MVKKWCIIVVIIASLIFACVAEGIYVNKAFDDMVLRLENFRVMLEATEDNINTTQNVDYLEVLHTDFHKQEKVLKSLIWHTGLKDVEIGISRILSYVQENDYTEAITETNALIDYCEHYSLDFAITPENIL